MLFNTIAMETNYLFYTIWEIVVLSRAREIEDATAGLEFYFSVTFQLITVNQK